VTLVATLPVTAVVAGLAMFAIGLAWRVVIEGGGSVSPRLSRAAFIDR
jgi:hypothetical protein